MILLVLVYISIVLFNVFALEALRKLLINRYNSFIKMLSVFHSLVPIVFAKHG